MAMGQHTQARCFVGAVGGHVAAAQALRAWLIHSMFEDGIHDGAATTLGLAAARSPCTAHTHAPAHSAHLVILGHLLKARVLINS